MSFLDDLYETGENPTPWRPRYAEHMNALARSGGAGVANEPNVGHASKGHKVHPPLTEDEKRWLDSLLTARSFDDLYRETLRDLGVKA